MRSLWEERTDRAIGDLAGDELVVLLGDAGSGKTTSLLATLPYREGLPVALDVRGLTPEGLREAVSAAVEAAAAPVALLVDGLDEGRVPVAMLVDAVWKAWTSRVNPTPDDRIRFACRTSAWPFPEDDPRFVGCAWELNELTLPQIKEAAAYRGRDAEAFVERLRRHSLLDQASVPLDLVAMLDHDLLLSRGPLTETLIVRSLEGESEGLVSERLGVLAALAAVDRFTDRTGPSHGPARDVLQLRHCRLRDDRLLELTAARIDAAIRATRLAQPAADGRRVDWAHASRADFLAAAYLRWNRLTADQTLDLLRAWDRRIAPSLHGVVSFIDAHFDPRVVQAIAAVDPVAALHMDLQAHPQELRALVTEYLLRGAEEQASHEIRAVEDKLARLHHPNLAAQLRPVLHDPACHWRARRLAAHIVRATKLDECVDDLVAVALDRDEADMALRNTCAATVAERGDDASRLRLLPLVHAPDPRDVDLELLGCALKAAWSAGAVDLDLLISTASGAVSDHVWGTWTVFFHVLDLELVVERFGVAGLIRLLLSTLPQGDHHAIAVVHERGVRWLFSHAPEDPDVLHHLVRLLHRQPSILPTSFTSLQEHVRQWQDDDRRRLVEALGDAQTGGERTSMMRRWELERRGDLPWLVDLTLSTPTPPDWMIEDIEHLARPESTDDLDQLCRMLIRHPALEERFSSHLMCPLEGGLAQHLRRMHELKVERTEPPMLDPPPRQRVLGSLRRSESDPVQWWPDLLAQLTLRPNSTHYETSFRLRIETLPGWGEADDATRLQIRVVAARYLAELDVEVDVQHWFATSSLSWRLGAGLRAIDLLLDVHALAESLDEALAPWLPVLLTWGLEDRNHDDRARTRAAVARAWAVAPGDVVDWVQRILRNKSDFEADGALDVAPCNDARLLAVLQDALRDPTLTSHHHVVARHLLRNGPPGVAIVANTLHERPDHLGLKRWIELATEAIDSGQPEVWEAIQAGLPDREVLRELLRDAGSTARLRPLVRALPLDAAVALFRDMYVAFPPSDDPVRRGVSLVTARDEIKWLRSAMLEDLALRASRPDLEALRALEALAVEFGDDARWAVARARDRLREALWQPVSVHTLARLTAVPTSRVLRDPDQHGQVLDDALRRITDGLRNDRRLWRHTSPGRRQPEDRATLVRLLGDALLDDLHTNLLEVAFEVTVCDEGIRVLLRGTGAASVLHASTVVSVMPAWELHDPTPGAVVILHFSSHVWDDEDPRKAQSTSSEAQCRQWAQDRGGYLLQAHFVETEADLVSALPWARHALYLLREQGAALEIVTSERDASTWWLTTTWPPDLRARYGFRPRVLTLLRDQPTDIQAIRRAEGRLQDLPDDADQDVDALLVIDPVNDLAARLGRLSGRRMTRIAWAPDGSTPLEVAVARAALSFDLFDDLHPVRGNQLFGRSKDAARLRDAMLDHRFQVVTGLRQVGKTSLVRQVTRSLPEDVRVAWLDVQTIGDRDDAALLDELRVSCLGTSPEAPPWGRWKDLQRWLSEPAQSVLVIDEFDLLFEGMQGEPAFPGVVQLFRILDHHARNADNLAVVLVGRDTGVLERPHWSEAANPLWGRMDEPLRLGSLGPDEARDLLHTLGRRVGLAEIPSELDEILMAETHGLPMLVRYFGSTMRGHQDADVGELIAHYREHPRVRAIAADAIALLRQRDPQAFSTLLELLAHPHNASSAPLKVLEAWGVVRQSSGAQNVLPVVRERVPVTLLAASPQSEAYRA
jgi:hypothetical protein